MRIQFWGVRGSIAVSGEKFIKFGGNTTCVVIEHEGYHLILDGGTGLKAFGDSLKGAPLTAALFFTHVHWDHIQGIPFFTPAFHPHSNITVHGVSRDGWDFKKVLAAQMTPPNFPIPFDVLTGIKKVSNIHSEQEYQIGPFIIEALEQNHPDGVVVYRIKIKDHTVVFATDVEHGGEAINQSLIDFCQDIDLLIHDAQYTRNEYYGKGGPSRKGWGHCMWNEAVNVAKEASVKQLALFHHDPNRTDQDILKIEAQAQLIFPKTIAAYEGLEITLS
jgi:phosphoribosyl 1,2-cyclic phosphodiesterase